MRVSVAIILLMAGISMRASDYTAYLGDANPYQIAAMTTDDLGTTYVAGSRSIIIPAPQGFPSTDIFVNKLDSSGNLTLIATIGGKSVDQASGIAVDLSGNIYVVGTTTSTNFPLHHPFQSVAGPTQTGILFKLSPDGTILFSTYLGGTNGSSSLNAVAVDSQGNAYVTGETSARDYPRTAGLPAGLVSGPGPGAVSGAFFAKISGSGDLVYAGVLSSSAHACGGGSSCFLSPIRTVGTSIAVDPAGNAYVAGNTYGLGIDSIRTAGALLPSGIGAFVARVSSAGTGLDYLTFLSSSNNIPGGGVFPGSNPANFVYAITVDAVGDAYIAGSTSDLVFPVTASAFQSKLSLPANFIPSSIPPSDAFVVKLNPAGSAIVWATLLGGTAQDQAKTIAADPAGNIWISGISSSNDFPGSSNWPYGQEFLAELNSSGSGLIYSQLFPNNVVAAGLAVDRNGMVHAGGAAGLTSSFTPGDAPGQTSAPHIFGITNAAGGSLAGRVAPGELIAIYGLHLGPATPLSGTFDASGFLPTSLAGVQVKINGIASPLLYVSEMQVNAVVPSVLPSGSATLQMFDNGTAVPGFGLVVDPVAPQVFHNADGTAIAVNADGTLNSKNTPAKPGSSVSLFATGTNLTFSPGADGQVASGGGAFCRCEIHSLPDGRSLPVSYASGTPGVVNGFVRIDAQIEVLLNSSGHYYLAVDGKYSDLFSIYASQ